MLHYVCRADESIINPAFGRGFLFWLNYERLKYFLVKVLHILVWVVIISTMEQEQNNSQQNQSLTSDVNNRKSGSTYFWPIVIILILALGLGYWLTLKQRNGDPDLSLSPSEVEQLSQDDKNTVLDKQLADLLAQEKALTAESDKGDRFTVYIQLGEVYSALGRGDEAIAALDKIKDERSGNTRLWMTYAQAYKSKGDLVRAQANVRQALALDAELAQNWLYMFTLLDGLDRAGQEAIYKEALTATNNDPEITAAYQAWQSSQQ